MGIPSSMTEESLWGGALGKVGPIKKVRIIEDKRGRSRTFGFITFHKKEDAMKAIQAGYLQINEKIRLQVKKCRPNPKNSPVMVLKFLPLGATVEEVKVGLREHGELAEVDIDYKARHGPSATVKFKNFGDLKSAKSMYKSHAIFVRGKSVICE